MHMLNESSKVLLLLSLLKGISFSIPILACLYTNADVFFFLILLDRSVAGSFSAELLSYVH